MTLIRAARPDDVANILLILNPIIETTTVIFTPDLSHEKDVLDGIDSHAVRGDPYLVADLRGAIQGFARYGPFRAGAGYDTCVEITVHLAPAARGLGIGRMLVEALEVHARDAGKHSLIAGISGENDNALQFHAKLGFEEVGRIPDVGNKFGRFLDLVLMQKFL